MKVIVFAAALAAAFLAPLPAQAQSSDTLKLAQRLVVRSGLAEQLNSVPKQLEMELKLARGTVPDDLLAALNEASIESFRPDALREDVARTLAARMPAEEMKRALSWLASLPRLSAVQMSSLIRMQTISTTPATSRGWSSRSWKAGPTWSWEIARCKGFGTSRSSRNSCTGERPLALT